ncbi:MAG TPA: type II and III secretion system protein family protein [Stellaceae bacterium]|nr:type II and III secretion system protein family protein [Stellaceae bacterium]
MTRFSFRLVALILALAGAAMLAPPPAAAQSRIVNTAGAPLTVEVGKGELVRLDHPVNSVFVADPDVADVQVKSATLVYVFGKSGGETTLYAVGDNDQVVLNRRVRVTYDVGRVEDAIHRMAPRSAVSVASIDDSLVLQGTVYSASEADDIRRVVAHFVPDPKQLINKMKVDAPNQIQLRVRVAEVDRNVIKELGINWESMFGTGNFVFGLATGHNVLNAVPSTSSAASALPFFDVFNTRTAVPNTSTLNNVNNLTAGFNAGSSNVNAVIDALDQNGLVTILAEPNLTALSGEPASFLAGGEFPVPVPQASNNGVSQITIEWKKFGVSLNFVSTIDANNRINIHVQPEVSQLSSQGAVTISDIQVPALTVRRAETTVDVASGQSFAIAGLLQNNVNQTIQKFPWLGDVPVLGALFRSNSFLRNESELVIIVTPYIVRPTATAARLQTPVDGYIPSTDSQLLLDGQEYRQQVGAPSTPTPITRAGNGLIGPAGFELQ